MKVLVVDDDLQVADAVAVAVQFHWQDVTVVTAHSGDEGLERFYEQDPDVVVLDVSMPGKSGFEVLQEIRRVSDAPVLLLTARGNDTDQVRGLELGADDYVVKPFNHLTLLARIKAVVRRAKFPTPTRALPDFVAGDLSVNFESQEVRLKGEVVQLTAVEYKLLYHLVRNAGRLMPHQALLERVWGTEWGATSNNLKALVSRLRRKLEPDERGPRYIENARGSGYRFVKPAGSDGTERGQSGSARSAG
jgi:two-component system KDP operon response regulator KdpE